MSEPEVTTQTEAADAAKKA